MILANGRPGSVYNIATQEEHTNKEIVLMLCKIMDELTSTSHTPYASLIKYVKDRPGHDRKYSLDASKLRKEIGWKPSGTFQEHLRYTVQWYLHNLAWVENVISGEYRDWITTNYYDREPVS
jgi:dTDP-glucose 4,6-dehydratase